MQPITIGRALAKDVRVLRFDAPIVHTYSPLDHAREPHEAYLERFARGGTPVLLLGMNPGPFGMLQTGVPFGEVGIVRDWLGIQGRVERPVREHPRRPIEGFACRRSEVSGARLWGWARQRYGTPAAFFRQFFVWNWCPLVFLEASGKNLTPDKLPAHELAPLASACDRALQRMVEFLGSEWVVGVGKFAAARAELALAAGQRSDGVRVGSILHPSPANPAANRGWAAAAEAGLRALGIDCAPARRG
jgi:single-strand selective monofunctional uracil DNA glycosylase